MQDEASRSSNESFKLLSWNIDGLDDENLVERTQAVVAAILSKVPDVVLLQEVVEMSLGIFRTECAGYAVLAGRQSGYFNAILVRSSTVNVEESQLESFVFECSEKDRHFLAYPVKFKEAHITLVTSHLESMNKKSEERKKQFKEILLYMRRRPSRANVVFGGDTNLRDKEVADVQGLPEEVFDVWEYCGSSQDAEFTWDMSENDNIDMNGGTPKLRFDRIFLRSAKNGEVKLNPSSFTLIGKERLQCGRFPSDHWGIWLEFSVENV
ncbi:tyrosyl-DNA phosphodiesterase 2-like [Dendronephthya gigantea]|uniref:tyrosyl-DNA phosphodiesterase 2-like n=1 Tax=Dendronephthya gigantea TaxID=151771 RepID=UPI00106BB785|nr:tyrosyl-DNA phosphodiesterase 2-like [Dendronephthya gigantea]XP_028404303.1 tyrosyl-DNA phosphodiesterase 2-like [Dendronephthya gigantea]